MKKNEMFFCNRCRKVFATPAHYFEIHGLDTPPYEKISICPICNGDDFISFNTVVEKIEVAEKLLFALMYLNRHVNDLENIFGVEIKNNDLSDGVEIVSELIVEMFDFMGSDIQRKILTICNKKDLHRILMCLKGEL